MWACLQDHDTANHWKQVAGWRKVCDLAQTHLGRLHEYRRGLAAAWPPETSAASGTYLAQLDDLIDKVQRTYDAAAANYTALSAATQAIGTTRAALRKVHDEYATKLQQKQAYDSMAADPKAVMGNRVTESPVTDGDLERLNAQARSMMFNLSGELQQAQATLQKPPPVARSPIQSGDPDAITATSVAPIIPPIIPMPIPTDGSGATARISAPVNPAPVPQAQGVGPVLGSAGTGLITNPATVNTGGSPPPVAATNPGPGFPPASTPISPRLPRAPSSGGQASGSSLGRPQSPPPSLPIRPSPPSGVIGGMPGGGVSPLGPNAAQPRKVNPIGGVIGGGGAGTGPTGGAGSRPGSGRTPTSTYGSPTPIGGAPPLGGSSGIGPPPGRQRQQQFDADTSPRWDPDNPWETDQGVNPIVRPGNEQGPIDPGPAIGFNR